MARPAVVTVGNYVTQAAVTAAAEQVGIAPAWLMAIIQVESSGYIYAQSGVGAYGPAQIYPYSRASHDPWTNLIQGATELAGDFHEFHSEELASYAYNAGAGRVSEWLAGTASLPSETKRYWPSVQGIMRGEPGSLTYPAGPTPAGVSTIYEQTAASGLRTAHATGGFHDLQKATLVAGPKAVNQALAIERALHYRMANASRMGR